MKEFLSDIKGVFMNFGVGDALVILAVALAVYFVSTFLVKNNAKGILWIFIFTLVYTGAVIYLTDSINNAVLLSVPAFFVLVTCSLFSVEIKRAIWSKNSEGRSHELKSGDDKSDKCINEIIKALQNMSKNDIGAIIILVQGSVPNSIIESGTAINSEISAQLIESVFFPKTPLHDGAMLIKGNTIIAAGCFLPLSQELNIPQELGTRHRAGIGITETIDVTSLIVSEETGIISIAYGGKIKRYADSEMLKNTLGNYYKKIAAKNKGEE